MQSANYVTPKPLHYSPKVAKIVGGWGSAPDPAGGAYSAPPDPLAALGWDGDLNPPSRNPGYAPECNGYYLLAEPFDRVMQLKWLHLCGISHLIPLKTVAEHSARLQPSINAMVSNGPSSMPGEKLALGSKVWNPPVRWGTVTWQSTPRNAPQVPLKTAFECTHFNHPSMPSISTSTHHSDHLAPFSNHPVNIP